MEEDKYIISFDKLPSCTYIEHGETVIQFVISLNLIPNSKLLKRNETILINNKNYIIKDKIDIMNFIILKCKEED